MCGTVQRFTKTACYTDFFPFFLMLSIHEAHYSVLMLYRSFLSDLSPLGSYSLALSCLLILRGSAVAWEGDVGSGRGRRIGGILGKPSGVDFELGWEGGAFFKIQLKPMWEDVFYRLDFSWPTPAHPSTVGRTTCQPKAPFPPRELAG